MAESFIPVPGTGEDLRTIEQDISGNQRHSEVIVLADPVDVTELAGVLGGRLKVRVFNPVLPESYDQIVPAYPGDPDNGVTTYAYKLLGVTVATASVTHTGGQFMGLIWS